MILSVIEQYSLLYRLYSKKCLFAVLLRQSVCRLVSIGKQHTDITFFIGSLYRKFKFIGPNR